MPKKEKLKVEYVEIDELKPFERNPRLNDQAVEAVQKSIEKFGFLNPIITDKDLNVCAGHTRIKAAQQMGLAMVPILRVDFESGEAFKGFNIADNRTAAIADWDYNLLPEIVKELNAHDFDVGALGFDKKTLDSFLFDAPEEDFANQGIDENWNVLIECESEKEQIRLLERFQKEGLKCRALIS